MLREQPGTRGGIWSILERVDGPPATLDAKEPPFLTPLALRSLGRTIVLEKLLIEARRAARTPGVTVEIARELPILSAFCKEPPSLPSKGVLFNMMCVTKDSEEWAGVKSRPDSDTIESRKSIRIPVATSKEQAKIHV